MNGVLIIDKPEGITSHDVVARCRRILRIKRIGHTGTLDPFATGVMVILVGKATRLAQFLDKDEKEYEALVRLGFETDTGDRTGTAKDPGITDFNAQISKERIKEILGEFRGEIWQTPPMYSAKKVEGKKLYELARQGVEIERRPQRITVFELELINGTESLNFTSEISDFKSESTKNQEPKTKNEANALREGTAEPTAELRLRVVCSAGTYIRVLAEDIGRRLGTRAHLGELRRTRAGRFDLVRGVTLPELEEIAAAGRVGQILIPMNEAVGHLLEIRLDENESGRIKNGMRLKRDLPGAKDGQVIRLTEGTELLAIGSYDEAEKTVQPKLVFV